MYYSERGKVMGNGSNTAIRPFIKATKKPNIETVIWDVPLEHTDAYKGLKTYLADKSIVSSAIAENTNPADSIESSAIAKNTHPADSSLKDKLTPIALFLDVNFRYEQNIDTYLEGLKFTDSVTNMFSTKPDHKPEFKQKIKDLISLLKLSIETPTSPNASKVKEHLQSMLGMLATFVLDKTKFPNNDTLTKFLKESIASLEPFYKEAHRKLGEVKPSEYVLSTGGKKRKYGKKTHKKRRHSRR
jgi:hypothetical protein